MDKKKIEIVAAIVLVIAFALILSSSLKKAGQKLFPRAKTVTAAAVNAPENIKPVDLKKKEVKPEVVVPGSAVERDPFALPDVPAGPVSALSELRLTGITTNGKGKAIAIINENMVFVGGKIGHFTVLSIAGNKVVVTDGKQSYDLKLEQ
ncbi:MAG: hypothetical protein PHN63_02925 [Candidatus Omnitrophica bacterium]|nr:hypothetical protein [Candidatus Omnitrophota bacterium]